MSKQRTEFENWFEDAVEILKRSLPSELAEQFKELAERSYFRGRKDEQAARESEGGEAVAWRCTEKHGSSVDVVASVDAMETYKRLGRKIEPLYTHLPKQQSGEAVDSNGLKSCPLCGGKAKEFDRIDTNIVSCTDCGCRVKQSELGMGDAPERWNKRVHTQPATPQPDKWIPCSERLPTEVDADCNGCIWVSYNNGKDSYYQHWQIMGEHEFPAGHWLWAPTGLTRPAPPEQESE